ncbi:MAG: glycoside hydrolase family 88 protein [Clostridia bacterium]|nr:glycoside hydrolase family 88 protein [Clostridia bacterium]
MNSCEQVIRCMLAMQRYSWEQGVCAQALFEFGRKDLWIPMAFDAVTRQSADGRLALLGSSDSVSDPAANGEICFRAYEETGDPFYLSGARRMLEYLLHTAPRTDEGIICHNLISFEEGFSDKQLWIDGLYMVPPFLAVMGQVRESVRQIAGYNRVLFDSDTHLYYHIADTENHTFVRQKHWATGNGWALLGLLRTAEEARKQGHLEMADDLCRQYTTLLDTMLRYQLPDGRFHDILEDDTSFVDGTSSMMVAAAIFRGIHDRLLPAGTSVRADLAIRTVEQSIDEIGLLHEVCGCPDFLRPGTSAEAQASYIMAQAWRQKCRAMGLI